ncbi:hypothetical protein OOT46_11330 [Aquabacterium sp. A7-Y]|uniref:hypothetical protein n=1 Tax=Aquabacterium sp. A7-Y TaxID=1349605 RepID=UPI00223E15B6|nr:hypothetical protein [Aquabacterium sp. A7-Y]MCW7538431.1 hypothetical protein [Aquabacterium sp. A7-Y]
MSTLLVLQAHAQQFVHPARGQTPAQQKSDEAACQSWAIQQSGFDPARQPPAAAAAASPTTPTQTTPGAGARGAMRGAVVGEIVADDAGAGAAAGAVAARGQSRRQNAAAQQASAQQQAALQQQQLSFARARAACLEGGATPSSDTGPEVLCLLEPTGALQRVGPGRRAALRASGSRVINLSPCADVSPLLSAYRKRASNPRTFVAGVIDMKYPRLVASLLASAFVWLVPCADAQTSTQAGKTREHVTMERDDFLKTHEFDPVNNTWSLKDDVEPPVGVKTREEMKAERDAFLSTHRWDERSQSWKPLDGAPKDMDKLSREQVREDTRKFVRTHEYNRETQTWVEKQPKK